MTFEKSTSAHALRPVTTFESRCEDDQGGLDCTNVDGFVQVLSLTSLWMLRASGQSASIDPSPVRNVRLSYSFGCLGSIVQQVLCVVQYVCAVLGTVTDRWRCRKRPRRNAESDIDVVATLWQGVNNLCHSCGILREPRLMLLRL